MTGVAALAICAAFTSCSKSEELYDPDAAKGISTEQEIANVYEQYNRAFIATFGQPAANQDWGFGAKAGTRANTGETYPETEAKHNMNHNEWADPDKYYGGYNVPDALTPEQKAVVAAYFQATPGGEYVDPQLRHFFIQQVYKGGNTAVGNTTEGITAASDTKYDSNNMNLLSVGQNNIHINDFNKGDCSESDVLNNGQKVGGTSHKDKITLMVNIDDTSCFGYHETGSSTQHNNKAWIVGWETIDTWAKTNYPGYDGCLDDTWNRSFMGFDLALKEGAQAYDTNADGTINYATYNQAAESPQYAWDGEKIIQITTGEMETVQVGNEWSTWTEQRPVYKDGYKSIMGCGWLTTNKNFYVAADQVIMSQTKSMNSAQASTLVNNIQNAPVLKDVKVGDTYYQSVINLPRIKQLVDDGYLPVKDKNLTEWVKVGTSDGYFSDWIVTLTEAKRQDGKTYVDRIICEDLNAKSASSDAAESGLEESDWDFNDVVFDVRYEDANTACIKIRVIGGVLPLYVGDNAHEVHELCGQKPGADGNYTIVGATDAIAEFQVTIEGVQASHGKLIPIKVKRQLANGEREYFDLMAEVGKPAAKIRVDPKTFTPCGERQDIRELYSDFSSWVKNPIVVWY